MNIGIIGAGRLGGFHAEKAFNNPAVKLIGVSDISRRRSSELAIKYGIIDFPRPEEMLTCVDAVVIAASTQNHYSLGMLFLSNRIHVLMEKPLAISYTQAQKLVDLAKEKKLVLQVGHVEQFNPAWSTAAPVLDAVRSGDRAIITAERTSGYTFRSTDIGVVHDLMVHDLDLVLSVVPSSIRSIDASGFNIVGNLENGGHEDIAHARIVFENGSIAEFRASRIDQQARRIMRIQTSGRSAEIDFATRTAGISIFDDEIMSGKFAPHNLSGTDSTELAKGFMQNHIQTLEIEQDSVDALSLEMNDFVQSIKSGGSPQVSGSRALQAVAAADKIVRAIRTGVIEVQKAKAA